MGQTTAADLAAAFAQAKAQGNGTAQIVYRKRLAAIGCNEQGEPIGQATREPEQPAKTEAAASRATAAKTSEAKGGDPRSAKPEGRTSPRDRQGTAG
jgi:hypothetical protein